MKLFGKYTLASLSSVKPDVDRKKLKRAYLVFAGEVVMVFVGLLIVLRSCG